MQKSACNEFGAVVRCCRQYRQNKIKQNKNMQYIILRKFIAGNQEMFACASGEKINMLLQDDWMFYLTNGTVGYASEGEAFEALSGMKNQLRKINLTKAKQLAKMN